MPKPRITDVYVLNRSTLVSDQAARRAVAAVAIQVSRDFAPAWYIDARVIYCNKGTKIPPGCRVVVIVDNCADADGWHSLSKSGKPWGIVAVQPEIDAGTNWTVCLSHEVLELLLNSYLGVGVLVGRRVKALEASDPCEADEFGYLIRVGRYRVLVSCFVMPRYFELTTSGPCSFPPHIKRPGQILPGGYQESRYFPKANRKRIRLHTGRDLPKSKITIGSRKSRLK